MCDAGTREIPQARISSSKIVNQGPPFACRLPGVAAPGVLPKALLASKVSTKQKPYPHCDFEDEVSSEPAASSADFTAILLRSFQLA
jgi:hypothetical protein